MFLPMLCVSKTLALPPPLLGGAILTALTLPLFRAFRTSNTKTEISPTACEIYNTIFSLKTKLNPELDIPLYF